MPISGRQASRTKSTDRPRDFGGLRKLYAMPEYAHSHASEKRLADLVRQLVFGLGHGLISILGLSIGVASATGSTRTVAIAGVVGMLTGSPLS